MSKTAERLNGYQIQMSIYAEQHKMILASDVLDMIEQLQDDLKNDVEKVVEELEGLKKPPFIDTPYHTGFICGVNYSIDIVEKGGVK